MPVTQLIPTAEQALDSLDRSLDLTDVRMKLADAEEGPGLSEAEIEAMEAEYRRFLALHLAHPEATIVPCKIVDVVWHQHILDTAAYRRDCEAIFGSFLDHHPYFGMRDEEEARELEDAYGETLELYRSCFGEPPPDTWLRRDASSKCKRTACKPQKCR